MDKPNLKAAFAQAGREAALEEKERNEALAEAELSVAYDPGSPSESDPRDAELKDEWIELSRIAKIRFPEGKSIIGLSPNNRLVAIAHCLGWNNVKIAKASKISTTTISNWINKRSDIKLFINEFQLKNGTGDIVKDRFGELEYNAFKCMKDILDDPIKSDGMLRLKADVAKWVFERTRGKPVQGVEHSTSGDFRKFIDAMNSGEVKVSPEEAKDLFKN